MTAAREYDKSPFSLNKTLLNSHFEAYKLDVTEYNSTTYRLPSQVSYQTHRENDILGFQELKDSHNQQRLVPGSNRGHLAYIDDAGFVVLVVLNKVSARVFDFISNTYTATVADSVCIYRHPDLPFSLCTISSHQAHQEVMKTTVLPALAHPVHRLVFARWTQGSGSCAMVPTPLTSSARKDHLAHSDGLQMSNAHSK